MAIFGISLAVIGAFVAGGFWYHPVIDGLMAWAKHLLETAHTATKGPKVK